MKLVIIDDHPLVRRGLVSILSLDKSIEILGEATNKKEAMNLFKNSKPDIALVDLRLGEECGLDLISDAVRQGVTCKFVVLTSSMEEEDFKLAKQIGVEGYVLKEALPEELINALQIISRGRKYYDTGILDLVMNTNDSKEVDGHMEQLTPKEKEVLIKLGMGHSNKEISQTLFITEFTVKKHVSQVFAKLGLADRTHAALYANAKGLSKYVIN